MVTVVTIKHADTSEKYTKFQYGHPIPLDKTEQKIISATWTNSKLSHRHHTGEREREGDSSGGCEAIKIMAPHAP